MVRGDAAVFLCADHPGFFQGTAAWRDQVYGYEPHRLSLFPGRDRSALWKSRHAEHGTPGPDPDERRSVLADQLFIHAVFPGFWHQGCSIPTVLLVTGFLPYAGYHG